MNSAGGQPRQMKLAVFMHGDSNYHSAGWRHPQAYADGGLNLKRWIEFAQIMERGRLDMLFIADTIGMPMTDSPETLGQASLVDKFEPLTVLAALSPMTEHLGLVATCATTYNQPYNIARILASIDHLSGGRCGWNLVTGGVRDDALHFNLQTHVVHADRYEMAEEFADVCLGLWDSFEDDAILRDKASGRYVDVAKLHALDHKGKYYSVKGPLSVSRSPQGRPVIIQAGASEPARELSARVADVVFGSQASLESAQAFYGRSTNSSISWCRSCSAAACSERNMKAGRYARIWACHGLRIDMQKARLDDIAACASIDAFAPGVRIALIGDDRERTGLISNIIVDRIAHRFRRLDHALFNLPRELTGITINRAHKIETILMSLGKAADESLQLTECSNIEAAELRDQVDVSTSPGTM